MFNLKTSNAQVIGTLNLYPSESARDGGAAAVNTDGPMPVCDDQVENRLIR